MIDHWVHGIDLRESATLFAKAAAGGIPIACCSWPCDQTFQHLRKRKGEGAGPTWHKGATASIEEVEGSCCGDRCDDSEHNNQPCDEGNAVTTMTATTKMTTMTLTTTVRTTATTGVTMMTAAEGITTTARQQQQWQLAAMTMMMTITMTATVTALSAP